MHGMGAVDISTGYNRASFTADQPAFREKGKEVVCPTFSATVPAQL
jgi:hypothetical protein